MFPNSATSPSTPAAGLLFPDWVTARTLRDSAEAAGFPGAQRVVGFDVAAVREIGGASPPRWGEPAPSRFDPPL